MFLALATLWGLSFPAISVGLGFVPPLLLAAFRYDTAAIVLLAYAILRTDGWRPRGMNNFQAIAGGGLFLVAGNGLLFIGQQTVPSSVAAIMTSLVPIVTALWAFVLLGERLSRTGVVGVGLGFVGLAFVIQPDPANLLGGDTIGRLIILGQVASVSLGGVIIQRAGPTLDRLPLVGWSMGLGAAVLHLLSAVAGERPTIAIAEPIAVGSILYLGVFSTAIAFLLYFSILGRYGAFQAALVGYLVPIVATTVGVLVLGEAIGWPTFVGFGLVALGFGLLKRRALAELAGARL